MTFPAVGPPEKLPDAGAEHAATTDGILKSRGRPDQVEHRRDGTERWTYYGSMRWSGMLVFAVVLPIPLLIPVGRKRVSIDFRNGTAIAGHVVSSEELWSAFLGMHLHNGWTAEIKRLHRTEMPETESK